MDLSMPMTKVQRNLLGARIGDDNVDRISKLPDEVLGQILSHLTTKEAVSTSILSKRWEYLWTLTPNIDFSDQFNFDYRDENDWIIKFNSFNDYVNRVIFYHSGMIIQKCSLHCYSKYVSPNIYSWVCAVIMCHVQKLKLETSMSRVQELPSRIFTCESLVSLSIKGKFVLEVPKNVYFPSLRFLCLAHVVYVDNDSMQRLFSGCPVLQTLDIQRKTWDGIESMKISIPKLKKLCIHSDCRNGGSTVINAPRLNYLKVRDTRQSRYFVNFSSSVVKACFEGGCDFDLLNGILQVKHLILGDNAMQNVWIRTVWDHVLLPKFNHLKKLELYVRNILHWRFLPDLLKCSPNLESLVFPEGLVVPKHSAHYSRFFWRSGNSVPACLIFNLKRIEISSFVGTPAELYLVEYLLQCGLVLGRMTIHCYKFNSRPTTLRKLQDIREDVLKLERSSSTCEVVFTI